MQIGLIGKKMGMTQVFATDGRYLAVTVIEAGPCTVLQKKTPDSDGYRAFQLGFGERKAKHATKPLVGHCQKAKAPPARFIREFRVDADSELDVGDQVTVKEFQPGGYVDVIGTSKGKGFQGVVRRYGFGGGKASHGAKGFHRRTGAVGMRLTPGHIYKNRKMPGHMGDRRVTTRNLQVVQVRESDNLLLVEGAVPGARGSLVVIRHAKTKPPAASKGS